MRCWINALGLRDNITVLAEYRFRDRTRLVPDRIFIRDLYLIADVLLMTSKDEGFGLPLLEAGMVRLPIACSDVGPFREVGDRVCFFELDEPPLAIARMIMEYLRRTDTRKRFRNVMRKYVRDVVCRRDAIPFLRGVVSQRAGDRRKQ